MRRASSQGTQKPASFEWSPGSRSWLGDKQPQHLSLKPCRLHHIRGTSGKGPAWSLRQASLESQCLFLRLICSSARGMGAPKVPWNTFWEPRSRGRRGVLKAPLPPLRCSVDPSSPGFAQARVYAVLFIWGPVLPVTRPHALPTASQEKTPYCSHP